MIKMELRRVTQTVVAIVIATSALTCNATSAQTNINAPATWLDGCWGSGSGYQRLTITQQPGGIAVTSVDGRESGFWRFVGNIDNHPAYSHESGYRLYTPLENHDHILFHGAIEVDLYRERGACTATVHAAPATPTSPNAVASRPAAPPSPTAAASLAVFNAGNRSEAVRQWRMLADSGDRDAAYYLGMVYVGNYSDIPRDIALSERYYASAANAGLPKAQANFGLFLLFFDREVEGQQWVERAVASGDAEAQWVVASGYWRGQGLERDLQRARDLMQLSAAQNYAPAIRDLPALEAAIAERRATERETRIHNPALEATHCVRIVAYGSPGSRGFTQSILNECGRVVEVSWCSTGGECERNSGNSWTLAATGTGSGYPVGSGTVRFRACFGRNSGGFEQGSQGQRVICTGEAGR